MMSSVLFWVIAYASSGIAAIVATILESPTAGSILFVVHVFMAINLVALGTLRR